MRPIDKGALTVNFATPILIAHDLVRNAAMSHAAWGWTWPRQHSEVGTQVGVGGGGADDAGPP